SRLNGSRRRHVSSDKTSIGRRARTGVRSQICPCAVCEAIGGKIMKQCRFVSFAFMACVLLAIALPSTAASADAGAEVKTAAAHANMAAQSAELDGVQMHLQHVVNCLVGPDGDGFDGAAGNPCKGKGNGVLNDMAGHESQVESAL